LNANDFGGMMRIFVKRVAIRTTLISLFVTVCPGAVSLARKLERHDSRSGVSDKARWGFFFNLGAGDQSGDFADTCIKQPRASMASSSSRAAGVMDFR
jgi:hypothetical protein